MNLRLYLPVIVALTTIVFTQCKKGDVGPPGTANVIYSDWKTATGFKDSTIDNSNLKIGHLAAPELTAEIVQKGSIQVYFTYGGGNFVLPYTSNAGGKSNVITFIPKAGDIIITRFTTDNSNSVTLSTLLQYRYVLIPGGKTGN